MPACFRPQMKRIIRERRVYVRAIPEMGAHEAAKCRSVCVSASSAKLFYDDDDVVVACVGNFQISNK